MQTLLESSIGKGALVLVVVAAFFASATAASAETVTTEEPVVLDNGETALEVSELTSEAVTTVAGTTIKCKKVYGWHGLKHPLFGYFYWFFPDCDGLRRRVARSMALAGSFPGAVPPACRPESARANPLVCKPLARRRSAR